MTLWTKWKSAYELCHSENNPCNFIQNWLLCIRKDVELIWKAYSATTDVKMFLRNLKSSFKKLDLCIGLGV